METYEQLVKERDRLRAERETLEHPSWIKRLMDFLKSLIPKRW